MATIDTGNTKKKSPQTKLTIAFPLVCPGVIAAGDAAAGIPATAEEIAFPQAVQNFSFADKVFPQPEQITWHNLPFLGAKPGLSVGRSSQRTVLLWVTQRQSLR